MERNDEEEEESRLGVLIDRKSGIILRGINVHGCCKKRYIYQIGIPNSTICCPRDLSRLELSEVNNELLISNRQCTPSLNNNAE